MKTYILLPTAITEMGGGQMYVRNKMKYIEEQGWRVEIFSGQEGTIYINDLKKYRRNIIRVLDDAPFIYSQKTIEATLLHMKNIIGNENEQIIIESGAAHTCYWGELLSKEIHGKHIVFLLDEHNDKIDFRYLDFFDFKHQRKELTGIANRSLMDLFRDYKLINQENNYWLTAYCSNVVEECYNPIIEKIKKADYSIGSIGRLEKPYVLPVAEEIRKFAANHPDATFNIIFIGGSTIRKSMKQLRKKFRGMNNINLILTNYMFPIPKKIFNLVNVFISSSGSARVSYNEGIPTIAIDGHDYMPIGIVGYTTEQTLYRENTAAKSISELLEDILINKCLLQMNFNAYEPEDIKVYFEPHIEFINKSSQEFSYYPVINMKPYGKDKKKKILRQIFGGYFYYKLKHIYSYLISRWN